jgi:hypothetical protein
MDDQYLYSLAIFALLVSDILLVCMGALFYRLRSRAPAASKPEQMLATSIEMRDEINAMSVSLAALDVRLVRIDTHIGRLSEQHEQQRAATKDSSRKTFEVATKLALRGAEVDELVSLCGLTRGEAELIRTVHTERSPAM